MGTTGHGTGPVAGAVVAGVRLTGRVGRGATGEVWAGTDVADGSRVAVKVFAHGCDASGSGGAVTEAGILHGLRHPHVLAVRRVGHDPVAVVTELADGGSLAAQVRARGVLDPGEVVTVVAPLADALAWVHARGVVHGDVTATNVLFVDHGRPVLADLGAARLAGHGGAVATPGYAAPEVLAGAPPTAASDVHGLGALAWLALTGSVPPAAEDRLPLRLLAPDCPDAMVDAVVRALHPDPGQRPDPLELAAEVRRACPATAVGLVPSAVLGVGADEAVTYRVREAARAAGAPSPARRGQLLRAAAAPAAWARARLRPPVAGAAPGRGVVGVVAALVAAVVVALVAALVVVDGAGAGAGAGRGAVDVAGGAMTSAPTVVALDALPRDELAALVTGLVSARARALSAGDPAALAAVHLPGSSTLSRDRALLAAGPVPVRYDVVSVRAVGADRVAVSLRTRTDGAPAVREDVVVTLGRHDGRWLVRSVSA